LGEGSVRDVRQVLVGNRNLAYTTVMTVLERLEKRGGVTRRKQGRSFIYVPKVSQDALRQLAVKELVDAFFEGSEEALRLYLERSQEPGVTNGNGGAGTLDAALL
jgi:predicted transcriptional regulator